MPPEAAVAIHYTTGGVRRDPVSYAEFLSLAKDGRIGLDDLIWYEGIVDWVPARQIMLNVNVGESPSPLVANRRRQIILCAAGLAVIGLLLYPPMWGLSTGEARLYFPVGHAWFWLSRHDEMGILVGVNWPVLLTYMAGICLGAGFAWLAAGEPQHATE